MPVVQAHGFEHTVPVLKTSIRKGDTRTEFAIYKADVLCHHPRLKQIVEALAQKPSSKNAKAAPSTGSFACKLKKNQFRFVLI